MFGMIIFIKLFILRNNTASDTDTTVWLLFKNEIVWLATVTGCYEIPKSVDTAGGLMPPSQQFILLSRSPPNFGVVI